MKESFFFRKPPLIQKSAPVKLWLRKENSRFSENDQRSALSIIHKAMRGDELAIDAVISHYRGYIRFLSRRPRRDALGFEHLYVDEDMQRRLESKLNYAVITNFKILNRTKMCKDVRGYPLLHEYCEF